MRGQHVLELMSAADGRKGRVEFVTPHGISVTTFADLWSLSSRAAHGVVKTLGRGRVAGLMTPSAAIVACLVGCLRAGRDFVSMPLPARAQDSAAYVRQIQEIVKLCDVTAIVVGAAYAPMTQIFRDHVGCPVVTAESLIETGSAWHADCSPGELIQFSSGTTGVPKGVRLTGYAIGANVEATLLALGIGGRHEVFCGWVPLSHDMGLIGGLLATWVGSTRTAYTYVCISPELFVARPSMWLETCAVKGATITAAPTFAYDIASRHLSGGSQLNLSALRAAIVGAEPIAHETLLRVASAGARHGMSETALCPAYGLAEATLAVTMVAPDDRWSSDVVSIDGRDSRFVSCGKVLDGVTVDAPDISVGPGPIKVAGPALCHGYFPSRSMNPDGWLDTGDVGMLAHGELFVTGRSDDLLCLAGRNFFAWELELAGGSIPDVKPGTFAVVLDGRGGYVALFELRARSTADLDQCIAKVRRNLVGVAGVGPSGVGCIPPGTMPKTPSGKIRHRSLRTDLGLFISSCTAYREF